MPTLIDVLRSAADSDPVGWLYLPRDADWVASTAATMIDTDEIDDSDFVDDLPPLARELNLVETLDGGTLRGIYICASHHQSSPSDTTLLEAFHYYMRFDAPLPHIGALAESQG